jgi:hypothetical protein
MKTFFALLLLSGNAIAQTTTTYVNQYGQPVATVQQVGNTTFVSNQYGQLVGSATTVPIPAPTPAPVANVLPVLPILPMIGAPR